MNWRPIAEWDYEEQQRAQDTLWPWAVVTDGARIAPASDWGPKDDAYSHHGWRDQRQADYDGAPVALEFTPTHFLIPEPPKGPC